MLNNLIQKALSKCSNYYLLHLYVASSHNKWIILINNNYNKFSKTKIFKIIQIIKKSVERIHCRLNFNNNANLKSKILINKFNQENQDLWKAN